MGYYYKYGIKITTLCLCIKNHSLLLAEKQTGFGKGKVNAFGGKQNIGETLEKATVRELFEETSLIGKPEDLLKVAIIRFHFESELRFECHVYTLHSWQGEPQNTKEMANFDWYHRTTLPFSRMCAADKIWIPLVLQGKNIDSDVYFNFDGSTPLPS